MTISSFSSFEDLNNALRSQNPFAKPPALNATDVWGKEFFDVETINSHASDAVFQTLKEIQAGLYSTTSIVISAQNGTGKTHIISRIRHRLQEQGGGLFVYANKYGDLGQIKQGFQSILADSLRNTGSQGVTQWQELATAMANDAIKFAQSTAKFLCPKELVEKFNNDNPEQVQKWVATLTKDFRKAKSFKVKDPDIVKAIFWTLSDEQSLFAIKWLEGKDLAQYKANELQLPSQCQSFEAVLQILDLISEYNQLIICFDELDTPSAYDNTTGFHISQIVAELIKDLFQNLSRGLILSVMMPAQWSNKIKQLPGGVYNKVAAHGEPIELNYMDSNSIVDLVTLWLKEYYKQRNLEPSDSVYPFGKTELKNLGKGKPTVREILIWCKEELPKRVGIVPPPLNKVEQAFSKEMEENIKNYLDNNFIIAEALLFGFQCLIGKTVEKVKIEEVTDKVKIRGGKDIYLNFKIIGKEEGKDVSIGVAVLQDAGGKGLGAGLRRLNDYQTFNLTRGCLVRSKTKKLTPYLEQTYVEPLIQQKGEYVDLKEDQIKPLIAIRSVYQKREVDYDLTDKQIFDFIANEGVEKLLGDSNPLLKEILSAPQ